MAMQGTQKTRNCVACSIMQYVIFFFFSSRRRHTRYIGDWSSDVCSSDLAWAEGIVSRVGGLMEDLKVYEIDPVANEAVLRSDAPNARGDKLEIGRASCRERV